jgi:hypothetical protein
MRDRWGRASATHGDVFSVPKEERFALSEYERAMHVLLVWHNEGSKGSPLRTLRAYGVNEATIVEVVSDWCDMNITEEEVAELKAEKRADKYDAFIDWTKDKLFEQYTTEALVEVAGFSYPTVLKFLQDSPHFRKVKKGIWEIRDPKADREAEK